MKNKLNTDFFILKFFVITIMTYAFMILSSMILQYYWNEKQINEQFLDCKKSNNITVLQNCIQSLSNQYSLLFEDLFFDKYALLSDYLLKDNLSEDKNYERLITIQKLYKGFYDVEDSKRKMIDEFLLKCIDAHLETLVICLNHYTEILRYKKGDEEAQNFMSDIVHRESFMKKISLKCRRNQFYDIYVKENKDEYNQIFKNCGWKFGQEKIKLNEKLKQEFMMKSN